MAASRLILCPVFITVSQNFQGKFCFSRIYNHFWKILLIFVSARLVDCLLATAHIIPLGTTHNYLSLSVLHILKFLLIIQCKSFFCGGLWFLPQLIFGLLNSYFKMFGNSPTLSKSLFLAIFVRLTKFFVTRKFLVYRNC